MKSIRSQCINAKIVHVFPAKNQTISIYFIKKAIICEVKPQNIVAKFLVNTINERCWM